MLGGIDESNLSAYLVAPAGSDQYIGLDAGKGYLIQQYHYQTLTAGYTGSERLKGLNVVITHGKPPVQKIAELQLELKANNPLGLNLIFPEQGKRVKL
ncbi:MAG TPA: hypothetical protein VJ552_11780 [Sediminibacterium sp.]|nr:hypothetical protein [Sediminibacterium sp.]